METDNFDELNLNELTENRVPSVVPRFIKK